MKVINDRIDVYVGLDSDGSIIKLFENFDNCLDNLDSKIVSVGIIEAMVVDYEEIYGIVPVSG